MRIFLETYPWSFPDNVAGCISSVGQRTGHCWKNWILKKFPGTDAFLLQVAVLLVLVWSGRLEEPRYHTEERGNNALANTIEAEITTGELFILLISINETFIWFNV